MSFPRAALAADPLGQHWRASARRVALAGLLAFVVALALLVLWAATAPLGGAIVANGTLRIDTQRKTVQHRDGGIVRAILVREGEHVAAGQPLIQLDDARVDGAAQLVRSQLDAQRLRQSRLDAERRLAPAWQPPAELRERAEPRAAESRNAAPHAAEPRVAEAIARESALFRARRGALDSQERLLREQLDQIAHEISAREAQDGAAARAVADMDDELRANEDLLAQQFVHRARVLGLRRDAAGYRMRREENLADLAQARQRAAELALRLATAREAYVEAAANELREAGDKLVELEEQARSTDDNASRQVIAAPVAGRVVDLKVTTVGGTLGAREPVLDLVPDDSPLLVEARVGIDAIGELRDGIDAEVRLTAYHQRSAPLVRGRVVNVSADALTDRQTGAGYYLLRVALDRASLDSAGLAIQPGMGAEVFVRGSERTALDYLLEPLLAATRRAYREH